MKTKYFFLTVLAGMTFAGCTDDDIAVESPPIVEEDVMTPISFSSSQSAFTRADFTGAAAAEKLNNMFVVTGFKGTETADPGSIVFDNYKVVYEENTANTTESNSSNWEYAGKERIQHAIDNGITQQAIKYWDYTKTQYDFIAWAMGKVDVNGTLTPIEPIYTDAALSDHQVRVSAIKPNGTDGWGTDADIERISYTFEGKAEDLAQCYISDIVTVNKSGDAGYGEVTGYDKTVTLKFRQLGTKVRIGLYETVPGYSVKNVKFYTKGGILDATTPGDDTTPGEVADGQIVDDATIFSAGADIYTEGTYTIYFPTVDTPDNADNNQAHIKFAPKEGVAQTTTVNWGALNYTIRESGESSADAIYLGRSSNSASFAGDADDNYYVIYLPNETGTNLNLRVDFTLESIDGSKEEIEVKNAKAQVPSIYTTWKPGFAYTYLFKISDKTNGRTGVYDPTQADDATINSDPAGLYPITFDALVVNAEDGDKTQETITTIATPSITTYQQMSKVVNNDEYTVNDKDIFVTVSEGDDIVTLTDKAALYTLPEGSYTEADVVDAMQMQDDDAADNTVKGRSGLVLTEAPFTLTNSVEFGANGNPIAVEDDQAMRFEPTAATTYAFVYTKTAPTPDETINLYQPVTKAAGEEVSGLYRFKVENAPNGDVQKGVTYYIGNQATFEKASVFLGQDVSNLYTRSGEGTADDPYVYTIAKGTAVTGTKYYYTTDKGMSYTEAAAIGYNKIAEYDFYTLNAESGEYEKVTDKTGMPLDNTAYYYKRSDGYYYCVFYPQRTQGGTSLMIALDEKVACGSSEVAVEGMTYFDMYTKNNGEYYVKVIKVQ